MSLDAVEAESGDSPDVVRACLQMTAAGIAVAVLPYALMVGMFAASAWWEGRSVLGDDDLTGMARVVLLCTLGAGLFVVGNGLRAGWSVRAAIGTRGRVGRWLAVATVTLIVWCVPPFLAFTTVWMFVGATLATRPLWWASASAGPMDADDVRTLRRYALAIAAGLTVLSHVVAWTGVVATAFVVPPEEFARIEAMQRAVERREREEARHPAAGTAGGIEFIEMVTSAGAVAAGRYVGGDMSLWQFSLGPWAEIAQAWIAPGTHGVDYADSWRIAALAFVLSLAFWLPWMLWWTWSGARRAEGAGSAAASS